MLLFDNNTIKLLRIPFSFFLMPVYFFAISQTQNPPLSVIILIFFILHIFIYPASNGYNSFMDKDEGSIGGLKNPPMATKNLFYASIVFDAIGLTLSLYIDFIFFIGILTYMLVSRAYSWKGIRLKKYPIVGFLSVIIFQGFFMFLLVNTFSTATRVDFLFTKTQIINALAASCMLGGVYPLTQIYQHEQDKKSGDITISILLGIKGTFIFSVAMFLLAGLFLFLSLPSFKFLIFQIFLLPVVFVFAIWMYKCFQNPNEATFENMMRMNIVSAFCMNICFIVLSF